MIAADVVADLEAAMEQFAAIEEDLKKNNMRRKLPTGTRSRIRPSSPDRLRQLLSLLSLICVTVLGSKSTGANHPSAAVRQDVGAIQRSSSVTLTIERYAERLRSEIRGLTEELRRLENFEAADGAEARDLLRLEQAATLKERAVRESRLERLDASYAEFCDDLEDAAQAILTIKDRLPDEVISAAVTKIRAGELAEADIILGQASDDDKFAREAAAAVYRERARMARKSGSFRKAFFLFEHAVHLRSAEPSYLQEAGSMAAEMGHYSKAIEYAETALAAQFGQPQAETGDVRQLLNQLGMARAQSGSYQHAISHLELALHEALATHGPVSAEVAKLRRNLGTVWYTLGEYNKAAELYESAFATNLELFGEKDPRVADNINMLGMVYSERGLHRKALEYYELALKLTKAAHGENHPDVASVQNSLGCTQLALGEYAKAIVTFQSALEIFVASFGEDHPDATLVREHLGAAWLSAGKSRVC